MLDHGKKALPHSLPVHKPLLSDFPTLKMKYLYFTYRNLWTDIHTWHMKIVMFHMWISQPRYFSQCIWNSLHFPYKNLIGLLDMKYGILFISHMKPRVEIFLHDMWTAYILALKTCVQDLYMKYGFFCVSDTEILPQIVQEI